MTTSQPPTKPTPAPFALWYYDYEKLSEYVSAVNPKASWILRRFLQAPTEFFNVDARDLESDVRRHHESYHEGAAESVAWFRSEFGDAITVRRSR